MIISKWLHSEKTVDFINGKDDSKRRFIRIYTILFLILVLLCFSYYIFSGRSFIWQEDGTSIVFQGDGWCQHFKGLVYYSNYLKGICENLFFKHQLVIPDWDFFIGEGSDILNTFHYYAMGDPIALFSVFVPLKFMHYFFSAACLLRLYLAGLSFSFLCFGTGQKNRLSILTGAMSYAFCYWALMNTVRHTFFLNPMIYFPLIILGIENVIKKKRPYLLMIMVAVAAASNFYFFYMIALLAFLYAVVRLIVLYRKNIKQIILLVLRLALYAITGVCMAGIILLPVLVMFLNDSRMSTSQPFHLFYPLSYYSQLPAASISNTWPYWLCIGLTAPVVMSVFMLFMSKKKDTLLKILFIIAMIIIILPIGGRILNGMSYMSNRWVWAFSLLCSYILVREWEAVMSLSQKMFRILALCSVVFYAACLFLDKSRNTATLAAVPLFFITLLIIRNNEEQNRRIIKQVLVLGVVIAGIAIVAFWHSSPKAGNFVAQAKEYGNVWDDWVNNEAVLVKDISDTDYPRMTGRAVTSNANIFNEVSSTQYYWSITNPYVNNYRAAMEMREGMFFNYEGYDDRITPIALSAVKYYTSKSDDTKGIPYGFELKETKNANVTLDRRISELKEELGESDLSDAQTAKIEGSLKNEYSIYENKYSLPLGYCYDSYITKETWDSLNAVQKQEAQLETAYVDVPLESVSEKQVKPVEYEVRFDIKCSSSDISLDETGITTTAPNCEAVVVLKKPHPNTETYIEFKGLDFEATPEYDLYYGDKSVDPQDLYNETNWEILPSDRQKRIKRDKWLWDPPRNVEIGFKSSDELIKTLDYRRPDASYSSSRHEYIVNMGYSDKGIQEVTLTFPLRGVYSFDSIRVYSVPMKSYTKKIKKLQKETLQNIELGTDSLSGNISVNADRLLCIATSYSKGWKAFVDDKPTDTCCVNERYVGLVVPAGEHKIKIQYEQPFKKAGFLLTLTGVVLFAVIVVITERKKKTRQKDG